MSNVPDSDRLMNQAFVIDEGRSSRIFSRVGGAVASIHNPHPNGLRIILPECIE